MTSEDSMTTKTRRQYTDEFKSEALRLVRDSGRPVAHVARDLGIADHLLYRWRVEQRQAESQGHTRESMRTEQEELVRLRRENVTLKQERDFYDVRRRSVRRSRDEISRDPRARPSLSDPPDVPRARRLVGGLLRVASTARACPVHPDAVATLGHSRGV